MRTCNHPNGPTADDGAGDEIMVTSLYGFVPA